jgi:hypothetical protein
VKLTEEAAQACPAAVRNIISPSMLLLSRILRYTDYMCDLVCCI